MQPGHGNCREGIKATAKQVITPIQKVANPKNAARNGYENTCDYLDILNKRIYIQQRSLACQCDGRFTVQVKASSIKKVFIQICQKWFIPHVELFATHLNHRVPFYVSLVLDQHAWDLDA